MAEKTIDVAQESSVQEVNEKIGSTGDTGGSTTAGSLFAKLNALLINWTSTRAGYIDTINTNAARLTTARATIIDNIGATGNTGGTTSAGTVMAKLNAILSKLNSGVIAIVTEKYYSAGTATLASPGCYTSNLLVESGKYNLIKVTDNWIPKADGIVRCNISVSMTVKSTTANKYIGGDVYLGAMSHIPTDEYSDLYKDHCSKSKGTTLMTQSSSLSSLAGSMNGFKNFGVSISSDQNTAVGKSATSNGTFTVDLPVYKGFPVFFTAVPYSTAVSNGYGTFTCKITSATITGTLNSL